MTHCERSATTHRLRLSRLASITANREGRRTRSLPNGITHVAGIDGADMPRVLVVDEEPEGREALRCILSLADMPFSSADSVSAALRLLPTFVPDVVVSVLVMPDSPAFDLARELRRWRSRRASTDVWRGL